MPVDENSRWSGLRRGSTVTDVEAASGGPAFVSVMEAADFWDGNDNAVAGDWTWNRRVLREARCVRDRS
jgi:hypothetical protein